MTRRWFSAGSFLWLLGFELRMAWRGFGSRSSGRGRVGRDLALALLVLYQGLLIVLAMPLAEVPLDEHLALPPLALAGAAIGLFLLSGTLNGVVNWFQNRGDLDLLLVSPIPRRRIVAVRSLALALQGWIGIGVLGGGLAQGMAIFGRPQWLAFYPVSFSLALIAVALAMALVVPLLRALGPRRAMLLMRVAALLMFGAVFVIVQSARFLSPEAQARLGRFVLGETWITTAFRPAVYALYGRWEWLGLVVAASLLCWWGSVAWFGPSFARAASIVDPQRRARVARPISRFRTARLSSHVVKELRLLARFRVGPQVLLSLVYLVPALFALRGQADDVGSGLLIGLPILMVGRLSQTFSWIALAYDTAGDLARSAPIPAHLGLTAKLLATSIATLVIMAVPLAVLCWFRAAALPSYLIGFAGAGASQMVLCFWASPPRPDREIEQIAGFPRPPATVALIGLVTTASWVFAGRLLAHGSLYAAIPLGFALFMLLAAAERQRIGWPVPVGA